MTPSRRTIIAVIGPGSCSDDIARDAEQVGRAVAKAGAVLICGGLGGVMEAACRGAQKEGGLTIGILPGSSPDSVNPYVDVPIATGLGEARNAIIARAADALIAIEGEFGTLSEIALALKMGRPVVGIRTWELRKAGQINASIVAAANPEEAVAKALDLATRA